MNTQTVIENMILVLDFSCIFLNLKYISASTYFTFCAINICKWKGYNTQDFSMLTVDTNLPRNYL